MGEVDVSKVGVTVRVTMLTVVGEVSVVVRIAGVCAGSVRGVPQGMGMDVHRIVMRHNLDGLRRTNLGSSVPNVVVRGSYLNLDDDGYGGLRHFVGILIEIAASMRV